MTQQLTGRIAIVTGGASGIGRATAEMLSRAGAMAIIADINGPGGSDVAAALRSEGHRAEARVVDLGDHAGIADMVGEIVGQHGGIDIVVNNAVRTDPGDRKVDEIPDRLWTVLLATNLIGPAVLSRHAIPSMIARGGGALVHIASVAGIRGENTRTCYGTAKAGLIGLSRSIAVQYGKQGITSNCIAPGLVLTPAARESFDPELLAMFLEHHMTGELGTPEGIAAAVRFLVSPEARFITGQTLVADGGFSAAMPLVPAFRAIGPG